jgi:hypothetical protein
LGRGDVKGVQNVDRGVAVDIRVAELAPGRWLELAGAEDVDEIQELKNVDGGIGEGIGGAETMRCSA